MINLKVQGAIALAAAVGTTTLPSIDGACAEFWLGTDGPSSLTNIITGNSATAIGAPTYAPGFAHFDYTANTGMMLDIALPYSATVLYLIRPVQGDPLVMSPGDLSDYNFVFRGGGPYDASAGQNGVYPNTAQAHLPTPTPENFTLFAAHYSSGLLTRIFRVDASGVAMADAAGGYSLELLRNPDKMIQIGGRVDGNIRGGFDLAALAVFNCFLGQVFLESVHPSYAAEAIARGLTVN